MVLVPEGKAPGEGIRLSWKSGESGARRSVGPGRYQIRRYVVVRRDERGVEWNLWAAGPGRAVEVKANQETRIDLDLDVTLKSMLRRNGSRVGVGGAFSGDSGMGLSLVKDKARIDPKWEIASGGTVLGSGVAPYG